MNCELPSELREAISICNAFNRALSNAKRFKQSKVHVSIEDCERLLQLLSDSIKTAQAFGADLREFDGTVKPQPKIGVSDGAPR